MSGLNRTVVMDSPAERDLLEQGKQGVIGQPLDRIEGAAKVTGRARYSHEVPADDVAYGFVLNATIGCGRIQATDIEAARAMPGVLAVIVDPAQVPTDGESGMDEPALPRRLPRIDNYGQAIGVVVAESFEIARETAGLVRVDYGPEPGRFQMADHLAEADPNPPRVIAPNQNRGDLDAVMAEAPVTLDATYTTPHQFPAAMEPHAVLARWEGDALEIHSSQQILKGAHRMVAESLGLPPGRVRVLSPFVGGGFGGKTGVGPEVILAAIAARQIGRPVKIALTRRQTAHLVHRRTDTRQRLRIGCTEEGRILAIGHESFVSQKETRNFIEPVSFGSWALYSGDARRFTQSVVRVNLPAAGAVRAPGEAIGTLAMETAMDEMAEKLGLDPIEFRKRNEPARDPLRNVPFATRRILDCYEEGARRFGWERRNSVPGQMRQGEWLIGYGMAAAARKNLLAEAEARVRLTAEGRAVVETDMTDIGTGSYTILAQVAGEMLGLPLDRVEVRLGDTDLPHGAGSGGSWGAAASGSSVALACQEIAGELARRMDAAPDELTLQDGMATARNRRAPIAELLRGESIEALGTIRQGKNFMAVNQHSYGAQFAEVGVNAVTGEVRVRRMLGVFDCGRILNLKTARSQASGGMIWGIGYALHEEAVVDRRNGAFATRDFAEYHIPVNSDVPQIEVHFIEQPDLDANPIGVKGIGETGISGAGAAVANAIYNACGVRARQFPLTLDKILGGLPPL